MRAVKLKTNYLVNPIGLGSRRQRFYWQCDGGKTQSAYEIIASKEGKDVWDSGKVVSSSMTHIPYEGPPAESGERICWKVRLWDELDVPGEWSEAFFEMGLLQAGDWKAHWISGNYKPQKNTRYPVDMFQKTFILQQPLERARLYISACGLYQVKIDKKAVTDGVFTPGSTDYRKRISYQAYDVTPLLFHQEKEHVLEISLADGWYRGSIGCFGPTNVFGRQTKVLCQLEITYRDGQKQIIGSDGTFSWCNDGADPLCRSGGWGNL